MADKSSNPGDLFRLKDLSAVTAPLKTDLFVGLQDAAKTTAKKYTAEQLLGMQTHMVSFTEDGSGTSYTATVEIPAGALLHDIGFTSTVLWDGTSASLDIGDDDDPNGWFAGVNLKATDLLVGEVLSIASSENWGGKQGVYLVAATGRKGRTTSGVDSGIYYGAASEVIFLVTPGAADGSAGRSFGWVRYSVPVAVASTNV